MLPSAMSLPDVLQSRVLVLDGAIGTELERRGVPTPRPLWSAAALTTHPQTVEAIHRDYVQAGADIIVANTFRTNVRTLRAAGMLAQGEGLNRKALELTRRAAGSARQADEHAGRANAAERHPERSDGSASNSKQIPRCARNDTRPAVRDDTKRAVRDDTKRAVRDDTKRMFPNDTQAVIVAASVAPVEDCYSPQYVPEETLLDEEHARMIAWLKAAGPDLIWIETMNTIREARAAARAAANATLPFVTSFVLREDGRLLSGERLEDAVATVQPFRPIAVGLNCIPPGSIAAYLPRLRRATDLPLVAYAHINNPTPTPGWSFSEEATPAQYARHVERWLDLGVLIVGGCCGTTPAHIRAVRDVVEERRSS